MDTKTDSKRRDLLAGLKAARGAIVTIRLESLRAALPNEADVRACVAGEYSDDVLFGELPDKIRNVVSKSTGRRSRHDLRRNVEIDREKAIELLTRGATPPTEPDEA